MFNYFYNSILPTPGSLIEEAVFSFSAPKIISTGQGGAIITDDDEMAFYI